MPNLPFYLTSSKVKRVVSAIDSRIILNEQLPSTVK